MERPENTQNTGDNGRRWQFGHCQFIETSRELSVNGEVVRIESKPLDVLQELLECAPQIVSKDKLIGEAWRNVSTSDQSLVTAISKLRKAFGGDRDSIILSLSGVGYRVAVPVVCVPDEEPAPPEFQLEPGQPIPGRENWLAERQLGIGMQQNVWIARHKKAREARVFKFATNGIRLRALQREVTLSRVFQEKLPSLGGFLRVLDWNFEETPFFIESEYSGLNLYEFAETEDFKGMSLEDRVSLAVQLVETIAAAHALGVLHNDLKPSNILVVANGGSRSATRIRKAAEGQIDVETSGSVQEKGWQVKVVDFGVASFTDPQRLLDMLITHHGAFDGQGDVGANGTSRSPLGSAMYCAPELRVQGATPHVLGDIYSLGVLLYQLVSGDFLESPEPGWETRVADPILREDIAESANVDPKLRLQSASELATRLSKLKLRRTEKKLQEQKATNLERQTQELRRARQRRPWLILTAAALILGLCSSLWFYRRAAEQRDIATSRSASLSAMNDFLTQDILAQSNPLIGAKRNGEIQQRTLIESINEAIPKIDQRFSSSPEIAGQLHEAVAAALNGRMEINESDREFAVAAQRFREAEGPFSQNAIRSELRREHLEMQSNLPDFVRQAKIGYEEQRKLIAKLPFITPELQAWQAMTETGLSMWNHHPEQGISALRDALRRAESTPGFNGRMLFALRSRFAGLYLISDDGPHAEIAARQAISEAEQAQGKGAPEAMANEMILQEALHIEGKFQDAFQLGRQNVQQFTSILGPESRLTIAARTVFAQDEGIMGQYEAAIEDDLSIAKTRAGDPTSKFDVENNLITAAGYECLLGHFNDGIALSRRVRKESITPPNVQLGFFSEAKYQEANCLVSQQEKSHSNQTAVSLKAAAQLLKEVDIKPVTSMPGMGGFEGYFDVTAGKLALLESQTEAARQYAKKARPFVQKLGTNPELKKQLEHLEASITHNDSGQR